MYLLELYYKNAKKNHTGKFIVPEKKGSIKKWTLLPSDSCRKELLQLIALCVTGSRFLPHIPCALEKFCRDSKEKLKLEFILALHAETENSTSHQIGSGIQIFGNGEITHLKSNECHNLSTLIDIRKIKSSSRLNNYFFIGYGNDLTPHDNTDDFDFNNPFLRVNRFHSLFNKKSRITDPTAFLKILRHRGLKYKKFLPLHILKTICRLADEHLTIDCKNWMVRNCDIETEWSKLKKWQKNILMTAMDVCRHLLDAFPSSRNLFETPGLILMHRPDILSGRKKLRYFIGLMDSLLPMMQFIVTLSEKNRVLFPDKLIEKHLQLPEINLTSQKKKKINKIPPKSILLIDVDGKLPNLALMKLSRYYKEKGKKVILAHRDSCIKGADRVFASSIFNSPGSANHIMKLKKFYGKSLTLGGSGVNIRQRLSAEIENMPADYDLYPGLGDRAMGFITRGCPFNCAFCLVPEKEGKPHQVSDLNALLQGNRKKLILLDDNILSHEKADDFLEEMASGDVKVNFTQTLDLHLVNKEKIEILKRIQCSNLKFTRRNFHFSLNDNKRLDEVGENFRKFSFTYKDNPEFICMYGFNTTLAQDVERFRFLRSLKGAYVFVQQYQPVINGPQPRLEDFFDNNADKHIDELIKILFPQNMKSMEKYYDWVSKLYSLKFRKIHKGLVDTIFRYNHRHKKGEYIATLSGTRKLFN